MSRMLLSIKPEYVKKILSGKKKFEYRKFHCRDDVNTVIIYSTAPEKKVVAEVELLDIVEGDLEYVWQMTKNESGILKRSYREYYKDREIATAYHLGKVTIYDIPKQLSDFGLNYTPQSFAYLE